MIAALPSSEGRPSKLPELTIVPGSTNASASGSPSQSGGAITVWTGSPNFPANSKSRWSCAGTAITAPVP